MVAVSPSLQLDGTPQAESQQCADHRAPVAIVSAYLGVCAEARAEIVPRISTPGTAPPETRPGCSRPG